MRGRSRAAVAPGRKGNDPAAKTEHMGVRKSSQLKRVIFQKQFKNA